jgi:hypothetical protein
MERRLKILRSKLRARGLDVLKGRYNAGHNRWLELDPDQIADLHSRRFEEAELYFVFSHEEWNGIQIFRMVDYRRIPKEREEPPPAA